MQMPMSQTRDLLKKRPFLKWAGIILLTLLLIILTARLFIASGFTRDMIESQIESRQFSGQSVQISGFRGDILGATFIDKLQISDNDGIWLSIENAELKWSPSALLFKKLHLKSIKSDAIRISRRPKFAQKSQEPETGDPNSASFLKTYKVDEIDLKGIEIHKLASLPETQFRILGTINYNVNSGALDLHLNNSSASPSIKPDIIDVDLSWKEGQLLVGKADIAVLKYGYISSVLPFKLDDNLTSKFKASGNLTNWQSDGHVKIGDQYVLNIDGDSSDSQIQIDLSANLAPASFLKPLSERIGADIVVIANADLKSKSDIPVQIRLNSGNIDTSLTGPVSRKTLKPIKSWLVKANDININALSGIDTLQSGKATLTGTLDFNSSIPDMDVSLQLSDIQFQNYAVKQLNTAAKSSSKNEELAFEINTNATGLNTFLAQHLGKSATVSADATFDYHSSKLSISRLNLVSDIQSLNANAKADLNNGTLVIDGEHTLHDLANYTSFASARAVSDFKISRPNTETPLEVQLSSHTTNLNVRSPHIAPVFGDNLKLDAIANMKTNGDIDAHLTGISGPTKIEAKANIANSNLTATASTIIERYDSNGVSADAFNTTVLANGPLANLTWTIESYIAQISSSRLEAQNTLFTARGSLTNQQIAGKAELQSLLNDQPLETSLAFSSGDTSHIKDLRLNWAQLTATGDAEFTPDKTPTADIKIEGPLTTLFQSGFISSDLKLENDAIQMETRLTDYAIGKDKIDLLDLSLLGHLENLSFETNIIGQKSLSQDVYPFTLTANGNAKAIGDLKSLTANMVSTLDGLTIETTQPLEISNSAEATSATASLRLNDGDLDINIMNSADGFEAKLNILDLSIGKFANLIGRDNLSGKLTADFNWSSSQNLKQGQYALSLSDLGNISDPVTQVDVSVSGQLMDGKALNYITAENGDDLNINASLAMPYTIIGNLPFPDLEAGSKLDIDASGKLEALWAIIGRDSIALTGDFEVLAHGHAPLKQLRPTGSLNIKQGSFEHDGIGSRMQDITVLALFDEEKFNLQQANAKGRDGGTLNASGILHWDPDKSSQLKAKFDQFGAIKREGLQINTSGTLSIDRIETGLEVLGKLNVSNARIDASQLGGSNKVQTVKVVFKDEMPETPLEEDTSPAASIKLDLDIIADRRIYITGYGADIEFGSKMHVGGTVKSPDIRGQANIVRGDFTLLGQPFDFTEGVIQLDGNPTNATIDLRAERTSDAITSIINVTGYAKSPEINFSSTPELPEDEVISRLLFGRSPTELSALEAAQLAAALAEMTGNGSGFKPLSEIQKATGLDRISVSQSEDNSPQLETGKYLSDDVYVELRSRANGQSDLAVEWEPVENVQVGTVFGNEDGTRVTVQWKKELD